MGGIPGSGFSIASVEALARYDAPDNRANYLKMQAVLANMGLRERSEVGRAFMETIREREESQSALVHRAIYVDSRPEWVYVVGSCVGITPDGLQRIKADLMVAALAHYRKTHCLLVIDRERAGYEVGMEIRPSPSSSPMERALGDEVFGRLKMTRTALTLIPS